MKMIDSFVRKTFLGETKMDKKCFFHLLLVTME